jgi:hypothetical protein
MTSMRGNGLSARSYVAVADLDPAAADALLVALRDRGVAAYAAVSPEASPGADIAIDRLYVDAEAEIAVRTLIDVEVLGNDPSGGAEFGNAAGRDFDADAVDEQFRSIIAGFDEPSAQTPGRWPAAEDTDSDHPGPAGPAPAEPATGPATASQPGPAQTYLHWEDALRPAESTAGGRQRGSDADAEEHYVPPPPAPMPHASAGVRFAWLAAIGGPAVLIAAVLFNWELENWELLLAVVAFLGGFVALVAQLGNDRDDDPDDGAVV